MQLAKVRDALGDFSLAVREILDCWVFLTGRRDVAFNKSALRTSNMRFKATSGTKCFGNEIVTESWRKSDACGPVSDAGTMEGCCFLAVLGYLNGSARLPEGSADALPFSGVEYQSISPSKHSKVMSCTEQICRQRGKCSSSKLSRCRRSVGPSR